MTAIIKTTNLQHESAATANITLTSGGNVALPNATALQFKDSGGTSKDILQLNASSNVVLASPSNSIFQINGTTEAMRINSGGYALISTTAPITGHTIKGINSSRALDVYHPYSDAAQGMVVFWSNVTSTQAVKCLIRADGDLENVNNSYGAYSDRKLKQDETLAASQWNDIKAIGELVKKFRLKDAVAADPNAPYQIGVVAQDIEAISPGLIDEVADANNDDETIKVVKYSVLYMKAVKALGEALERIETLEARVAILEGAN